MSIEKLTDGQILAMAGFRCDDLAPMDDIQEAEALAMVGEYDDGDITEGFGAEVDETNYDPYAGCDVFETDRDGDDW